MTNEKTEIIWTCDRCGRKMDSNSTNGWHLLEDGEDAFIGIKAMYSNCGVGDKYDLCKKCTLEIARQFVERLEKEE